MVFARARDVLHQLAKITPVKLRAAFAGRTDKGDGKTLVVGEGDERRFAVARESLKPDLFSVHRAVGLEVIQRAARAPGPRAQSAPVVGLARPPFVDEADNALRQAGAVVRLHARRD